MIEKYLSYSGGDCSVGVEGKVCIAMCVWKRPFGAAKVFLGLMEQDYDEPIILRIWNNNYELKEYYEHYREMLESSGRFEEVVMIHSKFNVYPRVRFPIAAFTDSEFVVTVDDDIVIGKSFVSGLVNMIRNRNEACGGYGRILLPDRGYWNSPGLNFRARSSFQPNYLGTGAAIFRREWMCDPMLYQFPDIFLRVEDLWLSFCLHTRGVKRFRMDVSSMLSERDIELPTQIDEDVKLTGQPGVIRDKNEAVKFIAGIDMSFFEVEKTSLFNI